MHILNDGKYSHILYSLCLVPSTLSKLVFIIATIPWKAKTNLLLLLYTLLTIQGLPPLFYINHNLQYERSESQNPKTLLKRQPPLLSKNSNKGSIWLLQFRSKSSNLIHPSRLARPSKESQKQDRIRFGRLKFQGLTITKLLHIKCMHNNY